MSKSHPSSSASATCRIEWRPSRWVSAWLAMLVLLAPLSLWLSGLPRGLAWPMMALAAGWALHRAWRYHAAPAHRLLIRAEGALTVDGRDFTDWQLEWRGGLAFIKWRDDRQQNRHRHRALAFWPDTLPARQRRELRLASPASSAISVGAGMAT